MLYQHFVGNGCGFEEALRAGEFGKFFWLERKNKAAALRFDNKQAFHLATVYRLACGRAADLKFQGDSRFGKLESDV